MSEPAAVAWLPTLDAALRGALIALLGLLGLSQLRAPSPRRPLERVGLALAAGLCVQVIAQSPGMEAGPATAWSAPLVAVAVGNSALFWLFARTLCDDDFRPGARHALLWLAVAGAGFANMAWLGPWCWSGAAPRWASAVSRAGFSLPLLFGVMGVVAAARRWRDDLIERRRWLRAFIVVGGSLYTLGMVLARGSTPDGRLTPSMAAVDAAMLLVFVAAAAWTMLRPAPADGPGSVGATPPSSPGADVRESWGTTGAHPDPARRAGAPADDRTPPGGHAAASARDPASGPAPVRDPVAADPAVDAAEDRLAVALDAAMRSDRVYRDPELSVAGLADRLRVPEYRLRRLINRRLGHRNFSAFLNGHRLAEVREALADPAKAHLPVLTLALEAGFGSIGPFNRAFKADTGLTPTEFRRRHGTDS